ncbi:MAG: hypothetical protein ACAI34_16230 [Verrucomicrobium sp.]|nr:hypothetical protein [Verrucomicrobium sp.]
MIKTAIQPELPQPNRRSPNAAQERDDWPLEEINKPLDSPEEYVKTETGPSLEE